MKLRQGLAVFLIAIVGGFLGSYLLGQLPMARASVQEVQDTLNVRRINVVEADGSYSMVLANSENLPGVIRDGEQSGERKGVPGILFYNNLGDEIGGLIFPAKEGEGRYDGGVQLSMDQIKQTGQAIALRHWRSGNFVRSNLEITDYATDKFAGDADDDPELKAIYTRMRQAEDSSERRRIYKEEYLPALGEKGYLAHRVFLGTEGRTQRRAMLELKDSRSRPRIRLMVDENDVPRIDVLDEKGVVVKSLTDLLQD